MEATASAREKIVSSLHPELQQYVEIHPRFGLMLKHPVFRITSLNNASLEELDDSDPPSYKTIPSINLMFCDQQEMVSAALEQRKWGSYVFMHERYSRTGALYDVLQREKISALRRLVGDVWLDCENIHQRQCEWNDIWSQAYRFEGNLSRGHRKVMRAADRRVYDNLPDVVTAYRGVGCKQDIAEFSWSLSKDTAEWFARRSSYLGDVELATADFSKDIVLAYFNDRNEQEIVVDASLVYDYDVEPLELIPDMKMAA